MASTANNTEQSLDQGQPAEQGADIIDIQKGKEQIAEKARPALETTVEAPKLRGVDEMITEMEKISVPSTIRKWAMYYQDAKLLLLTISDAKYWSNTEVHPEAPEDQVEELTKLAEAFQAKKIAIEEKQAEKKQAKNEKNEFDTKMEETIEKIKASDIIRQKRDKKTGEPIANAPEGIVEFCQSYVDEKLMKYQGGKYIYSGNLRARAVADAANKRIGEINREFFLDKKYNEMRKERNGYFYDMDGNQFAFQVAPAGEEDYQVIVKVVDLVVVKGKAPFRKGDAKPYNSDDLNEEVRLAYDAYIGDKDSPYFKHSRPANRQGKKEVINKPRMKKGPGEPKKTVEPKPKAAPKVKPEPTPEEKAITDAILANPELKIINQFLGAFAKKKSKVAGVELSHDAIETIIRKAVDIINEDGEDDPNVKTPKSHQDLADMAINPDSLPLIAEDLKKELEQLQ